MKYYIKERINPQLSKPYYVKMGKTTQRKADKASKPVYGNNNITSYDTEQEYLSAIEQLLKDGFEVY